MAAALVAICCFAVADARQASYRATALAAPAKRGVLTPTLSASYLRSQLRRGEDELLMRVERDGLRRQLLAGVAVLPAAGGRLVELSAVAGTPARAERLLDLVARQLDAMSAAELARGARRTLRRTNARLTADAPETEERDRLLALRAGLRRYLRRPRARFGLGSMRVEQPTRTVDRIVESLPGAFPQRPSPLWAAAAGAAFAGGLGWAMLLLGGPRRTHR